MAWVMSRRHGFATHITNRCFSTLTQRCSSANKGNTRTSGKKFVELFLGGSPMYLLWYHGSLMVVLSLAAASLFAGTVIYFGPRPRPADWSYHLSARGWGTPARWSLRRKLNCWRDWVCRRGDAWYRGLSHRGQVARRVPRGTKCLPPIGTYSVCGAFAAALCVLDVFVVGVAAYGIVNQENIITPPGICLYITRGFSSFINCFCRSTRYRSSPLWPSQDLPLQTNRSFDLVAPLYTNIVHKATPLVANSVLVISITWMVNYICELLDSFSKSVSSIKYLVTRLWCDYMTLFTRRRKFSGFKGIFMDTRHLVLYPHYL